MASLFPAGLSKKEVEALEGLKDEVRKQFWTVKFTSDLKLYKPQFLHVFLFFLWPWSKKYDQSNYEVAEKTVGVDDLTPKSEPVSIVERSEKALLKTPRRSSRHAPASKVDKNEIKETERDEIAGSEVPKSGIPRLSVSIETARALLYVPRKPITRRLVTSFRVVHTLILAYFLTLIGIIVSNYFELGLTNHGYPKALDFSPAFHFFLFSLTYSCLMSAWNPNSDNRVGKLAELAEFDLIAYRRDKSNDYHLTKISAVEIVNMIENSVDITRVTDATTGLAVQEDNSMFTTFHWYLSPFPITSVAVVYFIFPYFFPNDFYTSTFLFIFSGIIEAPSLLSILWVLSDVVYKTVYQKYRILWALASVISKKHSKSAKLDVYFKLNTPENVIAYSKIRDLLQTHQVESMGTFEVFIIVLIAFMGFFAVIVDPKHFMKAISHHDAFKFDDAVVIYGLAAILVMIVIVVVFSSEIERIQKIITRNLVTYRYKLVCRLSGFKSKRSLSDSNSANNLSDLSEYNSTLSPVSLLPKVEENDVNRVTLESIRLLSDTATYFEKSDRQVLVLRLFYLNYSFIFKALQLIVPVLATRAWYLFGNKEFKDLERKVCKAE